MSDQ
jgi:hypothetical protein